MGQQVGDTGTTVREHLKMAAQSSEAAERELAGPGFPEGCEGLHRAFMDLNNVRTSSGFGANPIGYQEMLAYQQLTGWPLLPWEVDAIRQADGTLMELMRARKD